MNKVISYILLGLVGLWILGQLGIIDRLRGVRSVNARSAGELVRNGAVVLDVRTGEEFAVARIPAARHIPLSEIRARMKELEPFRGQPILVSCRSGSRSARACLLLKKQGFDAYNLKGGLAAWARAGMGIEG